jgi:hypothetical protein
MRSPEDIPADIIAKAWEVVRYHTCITEGDICKFQDGCGCANDIARALMERDRAATERAAKIMKAAYAAGFEASGEGWNAEYPFADHNGDFEKDADWLAKRDERLRPLLAAIRSQP